MSTIESRVSQLEARLGNLSQQLRLALQYARTDAGSSLTKSRLVMEKLLLNVYQEEMQREPRKPLLGEMLADNQFTRKLDRRILARANAIREMGNFGPHGEHVNADDALRVLDDLCTVVQWYLDRYSNTQASEILHELQPGVAAQDSISEPTHRTVATIRRAAPPLVACALAAGITVFAVFRSTAPSVESRGKLQLASAESLANVFQVEWLGVDPTAFERRTSQRFEVERLLTHDDVRREPDWQRLREGESVRGVAAIIREDYGQIVTLTGANGICAVRFELEVSQQVPWVRVDAIRVKVTRCEPDPVTDEVPSVLSHSAIEHEHICYVELRDTTRTGTSNFESRFYSDEGEPAPLQFLRLRPGDPQSIVLRINAESPGTYFFEVAAVLSYRDRVEECPIATDVAYHFQHE